MKARKVIYAKLQTEYFTHGTGNMTTTLGDPQKHLGMQMFYDSDGLHVQFKGVEFLVPPANVVGVTLASEEAPKLLAHKPINA